MIIVLRNALMENVTPGLLLSSEVDCTCLMLQLRAGLIIHRAAVNFHCLKTAQNYHNN